MHSVNIRFARSKYPDMHCIGTRFPNMSVDDSVLTFSECTPPSADAQMKEKRGLTAYCTWDTRQNGLAHASLDC